ncbi:hypothetical protein [Streptomyces sp. NPDC102360]|uniref:hypothetical protein n=1 Tax=Streptomyces sp. NPDC102360 TaxID=3366160 RepID=UPI00382A9A0E
MKAYRQTTTIDPTAWTPSTGVQAVPAGTWWDAVRVPEHIGTETVRAFRTYAPSQLGPVIIDLQMRVPSLYFLVPSGIALDWNVPSSRALTHHSFIVVPSTNITSPPGPHWLINPRDTTRLTSPSVLQRFIKLVGPDA